MNGSEMYNVDKFEILGNACYTIVTSGGHIKHRINKCRQSSPVGMFYPGATPDIQSYLYRSQCQPTLACGFECTGSVKYIIESIGIATG